MQYVICRISQCPYCSQSGFCLNRVVMINEQGICSHLTKGNWQQPIPNEFKTNYENKSRAAVQCLDETSPEDGKEQPPQ